MSLVPCRFEIGGISFQTLNFGRHRDDSVRGICWRNLTVTEKTMLLRNPLWRKKLGSNTFLVNKKRRQRVAAPIRHTLHFLAAKTNNVATEGENSWCVSYQRIYCLLAEVFYCLGLMGKRNVFDCSGRGSWHEQRSLRYHPAHCTAWLSLSYVWHGPLDLWQMGMIYMVMKTRRPLFNVALMNQGRNYIRCRLETFLWVSIPTHKQDVNCKSKSLINKSFL
jgi:hypothetical protein